MDNPRIHFVVDTDQASSRFSPTLGIGYLSSYVKRELPNASTSLSYRDEDIVADIERHKPDIIGLSCTSRYFSDFRKLSDALQERFGIPILWGGTHISLAPNALPASSELAVIGEGEQTLVEILRNFQDRSFQDMENIHGIAYRRGGKIRFNPKRPLITPLDNIPMPDTSLLRVQWDKNHRAVMMTSRGCPCKCRFCASSKFWDRTRLFCPEYVVGEMVHLSRRFGVREILIYDDFFTVNKDRIRKITQLAKDRPELKKMRFEILSRADHFDDAMADHLRELGVYRISFGIESGNQKTLDYLKNGSLRVEEAEQAIRIAKSNKFEIAGSFIIGSPYESADEIEDTFRFIRKLNLDAVQITVATPFPGTLMWEDGKASGVIASDEWSDEYYVMYGFSPEQTPDNLLEGKKLLTGIERGEFLGLVEKALDIMYKTTYSPRNIVKMIASNLVSRPLSLPLSITRGALQHMRRIVGMS